MAPVRTSEAAAGNSPDTEAFRLGAFIERLEREGELDVVSAPTDLIDVASRLDGNPQAVLFERAGPEQERLVGNVMGSRRRMALAFDVSERGLSQEVMRRASSPIRPVLISSDAAPVHQVVLQGDQADLTKLPVHLQHLDDGAPYISAGIDISQSLDGSKRNVGYRRLMLRAPREAGVDMIAPSDFRVMYAEYVARKERMPVAFVVGSHPADSVAATAVSTEPDELAFVGGLRQAPVPVVRCISIESKFLRTPSSSWKVIWTRRVGPSLKDRMASTSAITAA